MVFRQVSTVCLQGSAQRREVTVTDLERQLATVRLLGTGLQHQHAGAGIVCMAELEGGAHGIAQQQGQGERLAEEVAGSVKITHFEYGGVERQALNHGVSLMAAVGYGHSVVAAM